MLERLAFTDIAFFCVHSSGFSQLLTTSETEGPLLRKSNISESPSIHCTEFRTEASDISSKTRMTHKLQKKGAGKNLESNANALQQIDPRDLTGRFAFEFERIDKNRDGWLSIVELHQGLLSAGWDQDDLCGLFELIDTNHDGHITKDEFISHRYKTAAKNVLADPNGYLAFEFDRMDKNKDGVLSHAELHQGLLNSGWDQDEVCKLFELIDTNKDGKITKNEFISFQNTTYV